MDQTEVVAPEVQGYSSFQVRQLAREGQSEPIFEYDESVFNRLEILYRRGATEELEKEWERCHAFGRK